MGKEFDMGEYEGYEFLTDEEMEEVEAYEAEEEERLFKGAVSCSELLNVNDLSRLGFETYNLSDVAVEEECEVI